MDIRFWLAAAATLACASEGREDPFYRSGSRIRAEFLESEDGERIFRRLYDTELETRCWFATAADGRLRCLPDVEYAGFADAGCTEPVTVARCEAPRFATENPQPVPGDACADDRWRVHEVGPALAITELYDFELGACTRVRALDPGEVAYNIGVAVAAERFVAADVEEADADDTIAVDRLAAEDGARTTWWPRDRVRQEACRIEAFPGERDDLYCLPLRQAWSLLPPVLASDRACSNPVAWGPAWGCGTPQVGVGTGVDSQSHEVARALFLPGDPVDPGSLYEADPLCGPAREEILDDGPFYSIVRWMEPSEFPHVVKVRQGQGRLQRTRYQDDDGVALVEGDWFFDTVLDADCWVRRFAAEGGVEDLRCIPVTPLVVVDAELDRYRDELCTLPLVESEHPDTPVVVYDSRSCPYAARGIFRLGARYDGPVYSRSSGACQPTAQIPSDTTYGLEDVPEPLERYARVEIVDR